MQISHEKTERQSQGFEVKFRIEKSFDSDAERVKNKQVLRKLHKLILTITDADTIRKIPHTRKIKGYGSYYRIKLGDYRLGMEAIAETEVVLLRLLHRKISTDISRKGHNDEWCAPLSASTFGLPLCAFA